jgi:MraZ protein
MDVKGRIAMPSKCRDRLPASCNGQIVATIDLQSKCLLLYPLNIWEEVEQSLQALPSMKPEVRTVQRLILGYASDVELDSAGRFLLPPSLRDYAQIEKKVVLAGQGRRFELWSEALWVDTRDKALLDVASGALELPSEVLSLTL